MKKLFTKIEKIFYVIVIAFFLINCNNVNAQYWIAGGNTALGGDAVTIPLNNSKLEQFN